VSATISGRAPGDVPGSLLLHPVVLIAIAVFLVNDHVLKAAYPGLLSGKLSDVAGLVYFPVLVTAVVELVLPAARQRSVVLLSTVALTGLTFICLMVVPTVGDAYRWFFGLVQWPFRAAMAAFEGAAVPSVVPVFLAADPTDLITLPALLVPVMLAIRKRQPHGRSS
jgi:hypothetical protein